MRRMISFNCEGSQLQASLDEGNSSSGFLIVSGGNEIRAGAYAGQAQMAAHFAGLGVSVFRYDRRGIGESEGENVGFDGSAADIAAAVTAFRSEVPHVSRVIAFGNCDAATALAYFHADAGINGLILANPWAIAAAEAPEQQTQSATIASAAAIRARYLARLKNPRSILDLLTGKIDLAKLLRGISKAAKKEQPTKIGEQLLSALASTTVPTKILIAKRDTTAMVFSALWASKVGASARCNTNIEYHEIDSASHSFADETAKSWLLALVSGSLEIARD